MSEVNATFCEEIALRIPLSLEDPYKSLDKTSKEQLTKMMEVLLSRALRRMTEERFDSSIAVFPDDLVSGVFVPLSPPESKMLAATSQRERIAFRGDVMEALSIAVEDCARRRAGYGDVATLHASIDELLR